MEPLHSPDGPAREWVGSRCSSRRMLVMYDEKRAPEVRLLQIPSVNPKEPPRHENGRCERATVQEAGGGAFRVRVQPRMSTIARRKGSGSTIAGTSSMT